MGLALPLGELSPQVTERVSQSVLNDDVNLFAYTIEISANLSIGKPKKLQAQPFQKIRTIRTIRIISPLHSAASPSGRGKGRSHGTPKGV